MKLTIEQRGKEVTVKCDDLIAKAPSMREAVALIVEQFKTRIESILK